MRESQERLGRWLWVPESKEQAGERELELPRRMIDASRGMVYYKEKYYRDSEDGQVYKCFRDNDASPGTSSCGLTTCRTSS